jgi:hypothetical protein
MTFLNPWAFLGLLAWGPIILLYFLKLKRVRVTVPSTWLWQRSIQDLRVNAPFQKLRKSLLLIVQLLLVAIAVLALARPSGSPTVSFGKGVVILIDRSASMSAKDVSPSRLEKAKELAKEVVRGLESNDQIMVISFSNRAQVVEPLSTDRRQIEKAIDSIEPTNTTTHVGEALQMALSAVRTPAFRTSEIVILSDGQFEPISIQTEGVPIRYVAVGGKIRNAAITALDVRKPSGPGEPWVVFAQMDAFAEAAMEVPVELYVDGKLKSVKNVKLDPKAPQAVIFELKETPTLVDVRMTAEDDLAVDNRAWAVVRHKPTKVLLVSGGNFFLEKALAQAPDCSVDKTTVDKATPGLLTAYDAVVLDGDLPKELPEGRYLMLGAVPGWEGIKDTGKLEAPAVVDWDRRHRVTRFINFSGLAIATAPRLQLPANATVLAEAQEGPLIFAWQKNQMRAVVVGFKVWDSDWPLRLSFPLMIANALDWLRADDVSEWRGHPVPGEPLKIRLGPDETSVVVTASDGKSEKLEGKASGEVSYMRTDLPGVYTIKRATEEEAVALNLLDPNESCGKVKDQLKFGDEKVQAQKQVPPPRQEGWKWFAWAALAILLAEWWIYHRRIEIF